MKRISKKEAHEKYGVITSGANSLYQYFLREDGCVVDSDGDIRYMPPYRDDMYTVEVKAEQGDKSFEYSTYSSDLAIAKEDAFKALAGNCMIHKFIGEFFIEMTVTQNGEFIDHDDGSAVFDGKEVTIMEFSN